MGDWSEKCKTHLKGSISTPMIGIKRRIAEELQIYNIDEYKTSKICNKTKGVTEEYKIKRLIKSKTKQLSERRYRKFPIHSLLSFKVGQNTGCTNRDVNSVKNMKEIIDYWFANKNKSKSQRRPSIFNRTKVK